MLKVGSTRRRPPQEVAAERMASRSKDVDLQAKLAELKAFEAQLAQRKEELDNGNSAAGILGDLIKTGQVKQYDDGSWGAVQEGQ